MNNEIGIKMYSIKDLQQLLHIGKNKTYQLVKTKGFPCIKIGKSILIPHDELKEWIKDNIGSEIK